MDQEIAICLAPDAVWRQVGGMEHPVWKLMRSATAILLFSALATASAKAQSIVATGESFITSRLLPGAATDNGGRIAGLRLSMEPGWKTYWRSPGETGIPPKFDWSGSRNIQDIRIHWPKPKLFQSFGMRTAGYGDVVLLPLELTPADASLPMHLNISADLGVCKDICVLENVAIALEIAPDDAEIGARQIRSALRRVPMLATGDTVVMTGCQLSGNGRDRSMTASMRFIETMPEAVVLVENSQGMWIRKTEQVSTDDGVRLDVQFRMPKDVSWIDRSAFRLTILSDQAAYDLHGCHNG